MSHDEYGRLRLIHHDVSNAPDDAGEPDLVLAPKAMRDAALFVLSLAALLILGGLAVVIHFAAN